MKLFLRGISPARERRRQFYTGKRLFLLRVIIFLLSAILKEIKDVVLNTDNSILAS